MNPDPMNVLEEWLREDDSGAAFFRAIQPAIPASLVSAANYARILEVASRVPGVCALGGFYFEFFLGEADARADISFQATPADGCPGALAARQPAGPWPEDATWQTLRRLAASWSRPGGSLQEAINAVWLEFDINGRQPYSPSFFLTPDHPRQSRERHARSGSLLEALPRELGEEVFSTANIAAALACLEHLPAGGWLMQIGCMLSRRPAVLRLCLGLPRETILDYLGKLGAPADLPRVAEILDLLKPFDDEFILHLDLLGGVQPKIGLDLLLAPGEPFPDPRLDGILEEFCRRRLCLPAKLDALRTITGHMVMGANLGNWPPALRRRCLQSQFREKSFFIHSLSHLKLVSEPGRDPVAKAYLGVDHHWKKTDPQGGERRVRASSQGFPAKDRNRPGPERPTRSQSGSGSPAADHPDSRVRLYLR